MPPRGSSTSARGRGASSAAVGRPSKSTASGSKAHASTSTSAASRARQQAARPDASDADPFAESDRSQRQARPLHRPHDKSQDSTMEIDEEDDGREEEDEEDEVEERKTIPPELLTHVLHGFFEKDGTRVSKDANAAVAKYMDIFVREAIARAVVEKEKGFLEVEDLEKIAPQLLLDL